MSDAVSSSVDTISTRKRPKLRKSTGALLICAGVATLASSCSKPAPEPALNIAELIRAAPRLEAPQGHSWPKPPYAKVIGYHFTPPERQGQFSVLGTNSVIHREHFDTAVKEGKALSTEQVARLLSATFTPKQSIIPLACYDPEHVFVFYSDRDEPVAAMEVCLGCSRVEVSDDARPFNPDFIEIAHVASELGIWGDTDASFKEYIAERGPKHHTL